MPQQEGPGGLVVIEPVRDWSCAECSGTGEFLRMDDAGPLCLGCADLGHLVFLPAGDAALTRRAQCDDLSRKRERWLGDQASIHLFQRPTTTSRLSTHQS